MSIVYTYDNLNDLKWLRDNRVLDCLNEWESVTENLAVPIGEEAKRDILCKKIEKCTLSNADINHFKREKAKAPMDRATTESYSLAFLFSVLKRYVAEEHGERIVEARRQLFLEMQTGTTTIAIINKINKGKMLLQRSPMAQVHLLLLPPPSWRRKDGNLTQDLLKGMMQGRRLSRRRRRQRARELSVPLRRRLTSSAGITRTFSSTSGRSASSQRTTANTNTCLR